MLNKEVYQSKIIWSYQLLLYAILAAMPFYKWLLPTMIVVLLFFFLISFSFTTEKIKSKKNILFWLLIGFYLLHIISAVFSSNTKSALFDLEVKSTLFLLPLCFVFASNKLLPARKNLMIAFITGNFIAALVCIGIAFWRATDTSNGFIAFNFAVLDKNDTFWHSILYGGNYLFYEKFSFFHHPTYFSMFCLVCLAYIYVLYRKATVKRSKQILLILFAFFSLIIFMLSSKAALACLVVLFTLLFVFLLWKKNKTIAISAGIAFLLILVFIAAKLNPRLMDAYKEVTEVRVSEDVNVGGNVDQRVMVWKVAAGIVKDYPLGVGNGDIHDEMNKRLLMLKQKAAVDVNINAHNQYLETSMGLGIPGLLFLLSLLFFLIRKSFLKKDFLLFFFTFVIFTNSFFESLLNTQAGTVFFAFLFSILIFCKEDFIAENNR